MTRPVVGRETVASPGPCESRCSSKVGVEVQRRCFRRQSISRGRAIQCLPTFARMTGSKRRRIHVARRGRSMGARVRGRHAAPMQSRKQASAGPILDERNATYTIVPAESPRRSH